MSTSDIPLASVARHCGFGSPHALPQAFAAHYETTPSAYRRLLRGGHDHDRASIGMRPPATTASS